MLAYLEEPLEPPDLEDTLADQDDELKDAPPLDARIGALSRVPVHSLANNDIALLVLDLCNQFCHLTDYGRSASASFYILRVHIPSFSKGS